MSQSNRSKPPRTPRPDHPAPPSQDPAAAAAHNVPGDEDRPAARWHDADELRWAARHWATRIGVKTPRIQLREMTSKWASISTAGRLTLNTDLLGVPKDLGEFVVVHELVHLLAPNHGKVFKSFMYAYLPDWQQREKVLQSYAEPRKLSGATPRGKQLPTRRGRGQPKAKQTTKRASPSCPATPPPTTAQHPHHE